MSLRESHSQILSSSSASLNSHTPSFITAPRALSTIDDASTTLTDEDYGVVVERTIAIDENDSPLAFEHGFTFVGEPQVAGQLTPPTPPTTVPSTPDPYRSPVPATLPPRPSAPFGHRKAISHGPPSIASTSDAPQSGDIDSSSTYLQIDSDLCKPLSSLQASRLPISSPPHVSLIKGLPDNIYFKTKCYQFDYLIGEGNFARVFHAQRRDVLTGVTKLVAIKVLNKVPTEKAVNWSLGDDLPGEEVQWVKCRVSNKELVIREKELLDVLGHTTTLPFLSSLFEAFQDNHFVYFVVPLCLQSLHDFINGYRSRGVKIPDNELKRYAAELLLGIENLHSLGWYHHDIKPDNIMISGSGHIQIVDFGCVQKGFKEGHGLRELGANDLLGARACQSPELIRQRYYQQSTGISTPITYRAELVDVWNYGLVLFEMTTCPTRITFPAAHDAYTTMARLMYKMAATTRDLLFGKLLCEDETQRASVSEIKDHPYFAGVNWNSVTKKEWPVEYRPPMCHPPDSLPPNLRVAKADMVQDVYYLNHGIEFADRPSASYLA